jgi:DNA-binding IclR family transcriptional regulator
METSPAKLTKKSIKLYDAIYASSDKTLKIEELMFISKQSYKTVHRALKELREKGYLAANAVKGRITTHVLLH